MLISLQATYATTTNAQKNNPWKQHSVVFIWKYQLQDDFDGTQTYNREKGMSVIATAPPVGLEQQCFSLGFRVGTLRPALRYASHTNNQSPG